MSAVSAPHQETEGPAREIHSRLCHWAPARSLYLPLLLTTSLAPNPKNYGLSNEVPSKAVEETRAPPPESLQLLKYQSPRD